jgi:hypothetical protein
LHDHAKVIRDNDCFTDLEADLGELGGEPRGIRVNDLTASNFGADADQCDSHWGNRVT